MHRRKFFGAAMASTAAAALLTTKEAKAQARVEQAGRGMKSVTVSCASDLEPPSVEKETVHEGRSDSLF